MSSGKTKEDQELTPYDMKALGKLRVSLSKWHKKHKKISYDLKMHSKLSGIEAELLAIKKLRDELGSKGIRWYGGRKAGYDLLLVSKTGKKIQIQVKGVDLSTHEPSVPVRVRKAGSDKENALFEVKIFKHGSKTLQEAYGIKLKNPQRIWIVIGIAASPKDNVFYVLKEKKMAEIALKGYRRMLRKKKGERSTKKGKKSLMCRVKLSRLKSEGAQDRWSLLQKALKK